MHKFIVFSASGIKFHFLFCSLQFDHYIKDRDKDLLSEQE